MALGSVEAVVGAVQEDARAESERIERELAAGIARLRAEDAALPIVVADAEARLAAARRTVRDRLAAEDWADHETALRDRERWIREVRTEGERALETLPPEILNADLIVFIREAVRRMPEATLDVIVPSRQFDVAERMWRDGVLTEPGRTIGSVRAASGITSGCIVQTADGRCRYENSYRTRAERFETTWRAGLGDVYGRQPVVKG